MRPRFKGIKYLEVNLKITAKLTIIAVTILCLAATSFAGKKNRKLTVGAYISSAKIEIVSGEIERYETAITYLDSLFINYGPHAEGLHLMGQIMVDYIDRTANLHKRAEYVDILVAYVDSLHMCCDNKDIKKKYRKDCDKYTDLGDSVKVRYWKEFYNAGIEQKNAAEELQDELANETDSSMVEMLKKDIEANLDSSITNMQMVTVLHPKGYHAYVGLGSAYEKAGDYDTAIEWLKKGLEHVEDTLTRPNLFFSLAIYNIQKDDFCGAIPYFKEYCESFPDDTSTLYNLAACYNNCKFYDSALAVNHQILQYASDNLDALTAIGLFHNQLARNASDSVGYYQSQDNDQQVDIWNGKRNEAFDSSIVYFRRAANAHPEDISALEQFGTVAALTNRYEEASGAFGKLTELVPTNSEYPRSVGDFQLRLKQFDQAITAYEKTVAIDPGDVETWERLVSLYHEQGQPQKKAEAEKKLKSLQ